MITSANDDILVKLEMSNLHPAGAIRLRVEASYASGGDEGIADIYLTRDEARTLAAALKSESRKP